MVAARTFASTAPNCTGPCDSPIRRPAPINGIGCSLTFRMAATHTRASPTRAPWPDGCGRHVLPELTHAPSVEGRFGCARKPKRRSGWRLSDASPSAPCSNDGPRPSCIRPCLLMGLGVDHLEHRCTRRRTDRCGLVCHRARRFEAAAHRRCQRRQARPRRLASPHCLDHKIESRVRRTDITRSSRRRPGRGLRLDFLRAVWAGDLACTAAQLRAAVAALPYVHQRLGEGGKKDQTRRAAAKVASRFVPVSPPRLVVSNGPPDPRQVAPPVP